MKRRGNGEGSIVKRPDGRWVGFLSLGRDENGKRLRKQVYGRTRKAVQRKLNKNINDQDRGLPVSTKSQMVGEYLAHWLDSIRLSVRPRTWEKFESVVRLHLTPALGNIRLEALQPKQIQDLLTRKSKAGLSAQSVRHVRTVLGIALGRAMKWELVGRNCAALTDPPKLERARPTVLTPDEVAQLRKAASEHRMSALLELELGIGLRRGEVLGLTWSDVDLDAGVLRVNQSLQRVGARAQEAADKNAAEEPGKRPPPKSRLELLPLKTPSSRRTIDLPEIVIKALRKHRAKQAEQRIAAGAEWKETNLVFCNALGGPLEPRNVYRAFATLLKDAKIQPRPFHALRHTYATLVLSDGGPVKDVSAALGHARASMTLDIYGHVLPGAGGKVAARMDRILGGL